MILLGDWAPGNRRVDVAQNATLVLANLEGPVLCASHMLPPVPKAGPNIFSTELPADDGGTIFTLANNHSMDYGALGLEETLNLLRKRHFKTCGAGRNVAEARRPLIVEDMGVRIGILACCEAQFGVAREAEAGTAETGPWVYRAIADLRSEVDAVVVSVHAAVEDSPWPSPYIRELYHSYIDNGAAVVHGHHSHLPQGYEEYGEGVIFYGMGNYAVDPDKWENYPNGTWSLGARLDLRFRPVRWQLLIFKIVSEPDDSMIRIEEISDVEGMHHGRYLEMCNRPLMEPALFASLWQEVALRAYCHYGEAYMGFVNPTDMGRLEQGKKGLLMLKNAILSRAVSSSVRSQRDYRLRYHMIVCESHRQMLATALGVLSGAIRDLRTEETQQLADQMLPWSVQMDDQ